MESLSSARGDSFDMKELENELEELSNIDDRKEGVAKSKINPLEVESILEKILGYLDVHSLKVARQVNVLWNIEGVKILINKSYVSLPQNYHNSKDKKELKKQFEAFLSYKSKKIPHTTIQDERDVNAWESFNVETKEVKSLKWNLDKENSGGLMMKLLNKLPNLKYLCIEDEIDRDLKEAIIRFCISKQKQQQKNKMMNEEPLVISNIGLFADTDEVETINQMEKFSECENVMIQNLYIFNLWVLGSHPHLQNRVIKMIQKLLLRNQNILTGLIFISCQRYLSQLQIPKLPRLIKFQFSFFRQKENSSLKYAYAFPPTFTFAEQMPNLQEVRVSWEGQSEERQQVDFWTQVFDSTGTALNVKKIFYGENHINYNLDKILQVFPNVAELAVWNIQNFESTATSIWKFGSNIKDLTFRLAIEKQTVKISSFDSILTGFTQQTVDRIKNSSTQVIPGVENLRVNPSVLDLKKLESLNISFWGGPCDKYFPKRILSVASEFAFKLMPKVKIEIKTQDCEPKSRAAVAALSQVSKLPNVQIS